MAEGNTLQREWHGLPVWAWGALGLLGVATVLKLRANKKTAATSSAQPVQVGPGAYNDMGGYGSPVPADGGNPNGGIPSPPPYSPPPPSSGSNGELQGTPLFTSGPYAGTIFPLGQAPPGYNLRGQPLRYGSVGSKGSGLPPGPTFGGNPPVAAGSGLSQPQVAVSAPVSRPTTVSPYPLLRGA